MDDWYIYREPGGKIRVSEGHPGELPEGSEIVRLPSTFTEAEVQQGVQEVRRLGFSWMAEQLQQSHAA